MITTRDIAALSDEQIARFWQTVDRDGDCWTWRGTILATGYGKFSANKVQFLAHRVAYMLSKGPIPDGMVLDHLCHNGTGCDSNPCPHRLCVNPDHLDPVTIGQNVNRSHNARTNIPECPSGHAYTAENTYRHPRTGTRYCRECSRIRDRARAPRRRSVAK